MSQANLVEDGEILWLAVAKVGNPPAWAPDTNYDLGDTVVPIAPQAGQENLAFQCVGFLGKSNSSQPVFPSTVGNVVIDGQIEWKTTDPTADPLALEYDQYYLIGRTVSVS